jgi:hypothetical protein
LLHIWHTSVACQMEEGFVDIECHTRIYKNSRVARSEGRIIRLFMQQKSRIEPVSGNAWIIALDVKNK